MIRRATLMAMATLLLAACAREKMDFNKFDDLTFSPYLNMPLVSAKLQLGDMLVNDSTLTEDADGGLRIVFRQDSIVGFTAIDFVNIPEQSPTSFPLVYDPAGVPLDIDMNLGTLAGASLETAIFHKGYLSYTISTPTPLSAPTDIRLKIKNATLDGQVFDNLITLPANQTNYRDSIDIAGLNFDLSNGGTGTNYFGLLIEIENAPGATVGHSYNLGINFTGLEIQTAEGFFGERVINVPEGSFDFDVSAFENFADGVYLTDPSIRLYVENSMGLEVGLKADFLGVNGTGSITDLDFPDLSIQAPATPGMVENSVIEVGAANSEIVDFLASLPKLITYGGKGQLNPGGVGTSNFIDRSSRLDMHMEIEIPLEFRAENVTLEEIMDIGGMSNVKEMDKMKLFFRTINGFPFDVNVQLAFLDSVTLDSVAGVNLNLLSAAPVDASGQVTTKTSSDDVIIFDEDQLAGLLRSSKLKIKAKLNTSNNGQDNVKLFTSYDLELKMAVEAQATIGMNDN